VKILIVADDLTGALDSAVAFTRSGRIVRVARRVETLPDVLRTGADVICVNTASREEPEAVAIARVEAVGAAVDLASVPVVMKKVDSRLKGHVAAETRILARLAGRPRVVAAPAIPDMGRFQTDGVIHGSGLADPISLSARFGAGVSFPDIGSDDDLRAAVSEQDAPTLWAGARGLAFALAEAAFGAPDTAWQDLQSPTLMALGSRDPITVAQVSAIDGQYPVRLAPNGAVPEITGGASTVVVAIGPGAEEIPSAIAAAAFAEGIARLATSMKPYSLLVGGGETADSLLEELGIGALTVLAETAPGVPVCSADASWGPLLIATKSGGFGPPDLLSRILSDVGPGSRTSRAGNSEI